MEIQEIVQQVDNTTQFVALLFMEERGRPEEKDKKKEEERRRSAVNHRDKAVQSPE